jgi:hypothetical protein
MTDGRSIASAISNLIGAHWAVKEHHAPRLIIEAAENDLAYVIDIYTAETKSREDRMLFAIGGVLGPALMARVLKEEAPARRD